MATNPLKIDRVAKAICFAANYCLTEEGNCLHCDSKGDKCIMTEQFRNEAIAAIKEYTR